jgi:hypothetical protein
VTDMKKVLDAVDEPSAADDPFTFTTKAGIVFKLKPVPPMLIVDAQKRIAKPRPPKVRLEDKETWEENLSDPEYIAAMEEYEQTVGELTNSIFLVRGTSVVSPLPDGIEKVSDEGWAADVREFAGLDVPEDTSSRKRYLLWLKYVAVATPDDFGNLLSKLMRYGGVTLEVDVAQAAGDFRSESEGDTASGIHLVEEDGRGVGDTAVTAGASS